MRGLPQLEALQQYSLGHSYPDGSPLVTVCLLFCPERGQAVNRQPTLSLKITVCNANGQHVQHLKPMGPLVGEEGGRAFKVCKTGNWGTDSLPGPAASDIPTHTAQMARWDGI